MFIDARTVTDGEIIQTDICIIGAGAAGITLARQFSGQPFRVVVLESGGMKADSATQSLYAGKSTGLPYYPLEAARLLGVTAAIIQADRLENARELAQRFNAVVVLKGAGSVIARPDGQLAINPTGNPGLATGGTGDVLAGVCAALLAQHWPAWEAALGAVWLHGAAADRLVEQGVGPIGLTAGELPAAIRSQLNGLAYG